MNWRLNRRNSKPENGKPNERPKEDRRPKTKTIGMWLYLKYFCLNVLLHILFIIITVKTLKVRTYCIFIIIVCLCAECWVLGYCWPTNINYNCSLIFFALSLYSLLWSKPILDFLHSFLLCFIFLLLGTFIAIQIAARKKFK